MPHRLGRVFALVCALFGAGCLGVAPATGVTVAVTPHAASVAGRGTVSFGATVTTAKPIDSTSVLWTVQEPAGGTVDASGAYSAPAAAGTYHVVATSVADPSVSDAATVTVTAPTAISVSIAPRNASTTSGGTLTFTATVTGAGASQSSAVTWSVQETGGGTVDSTGHYTAPAAAGTLHVIAKSVADPSKSASATVTVTATPVITVSVSPNSASATTNGTVQFSASVTGTTTGQSTAVTWSVQESGGGAVTSAGKYTAPAVAGTFHVIATSVADTSKTDKATVTVSLPPSLSVTTSSLPDATVGMAYAATLAATGGTGPYTWTTTVGSLPAGLSLASSGAISGTPTAAASPSFTVQVTDSAAHTATASLGITVSTASAIDQSILPDIYRTPWAPGIPGGIPADADPVRPATVWLPAGNPYNGYSVNPALTGTANAAAFSAAFQAAINSAGAAATPTSRKIVKLKAGTYYVNPQTNSGGQVGIVVKVDNVTIRGEGADSTRIAANGTINDYGTVILFGHRVGSSDASFALQNVTADALKGSKTIQVANASAYVVGDVITIDHLDGAPAAAGGATINGGYIWFYDGVYFKRQPAYGWSGPGTGAPAIGSVTNLSSANTAAQSAVPSWRSTMQETEITAISGNLLTLKDALYIDFPLSTSPQVWRTVPLNTAAVPVGNRWCGIENIAVAGGNNLWGFPGGTIAFSYMAYSWAKNVEADGEQWNPFNPEHPGKYGYNIGVGRSYRVVVRDSYVHGSTDENPGGQAYGIVVGVGSSACLVENNISVNNNKPIALNSTGGGNVIAYNYVDQAVLWNSPGWQESGIDDCHANFTHHDLIEGNWTPNLGGDTTHGNSGWHTHLRNYANGTNLLGGAESSNRRAVGMDGWTHFHAYIGNVLKGGNVYQTTPSSQSGTPIYQLGNNYGGGGGNWDNGYALAHIYRDGNWDNVNNGVVWASGARTIPPSFYLTGKPSFFGASTWPWVDPVAGTTSTLPAKARYDAGMPNTVP